MKRIMSLVIACLFALGALISPGLAAPGDAVVISVEPPNDYLDLNYGGSIAIVGDTLYIFRQGQSLSAFKVGDAEPTVLIDFTEKDTSGQPISEANLTTLDESDEDDQMRFYSALPHRLVGGGDELWAVDQRNQSLWLFDAGTNTFEKQLDIEGDALTEDWGWGPYPAQLYALTLLDGAVFLMTQNQDNYGYDLKKIDMETGKVSAIPVANIAAFAPYAPGKLLVGTGEYRQIGTLSILDIATGQLEKKIDLVGENMGMSSSYGGLQHDRETGMTFLVRSNEIMRSENFGPFEGVAFLPGFTYGGDIVSGLLPGGFFVMTLQDSLLVRNTDPAFRPERALRLSEDVAWMDAVRRFAKERQDIPIVFAPYTYFMRAEDFVQHMSGPDALDIYQAYTASMDIAHIARRGYLADLSGNEAITAAIKKMYPDIQDLVTVDGKIVGVPYQFGANAYAYSPKAFEAAGLTEADIPRTYSQLMDLIDRWDAELASDFPDLQLFEGWFGDMKMTLSSELLSAQMLYSTHTGTSLTFDTPVLHKLFDQLERTRFGGFVSYDDDDSNRVRVMYADGDDQAPKALLRTYYTLSIEQYWDRGDWQPMLLSLDDDMPALAGAHVSVLLLNPKAADLPEALAFLEYMATQMDPTMRINFFPDENEPIKNPYFDEYLKNHQEWIDNLEKQLAEAEEAEKPLIQASIDEANLSSSWIFDQEWQVSAERIAQYRAIRDQIVFFSSGDLYNQELMPLIQRFMDGQIKSGQFLTEISQKLKMMELEG